jgi:signal transduction histidine kinase
MKEIGSKFYLIGQIILMVTILLSTLSVYGFIGDLNLFRDLVNIGIMTDIFLLLIAQLQKEKHYINKLDKTKSTLLEYSRFSSIGLAINNITHQWKQPLSHLGFSIMLLESILKNKKEQTTAYLNEELPKMNFSLSLMKNTMDEFANYYSKDIKKKDFNPKNSVKNVVTIFNSKIVLKNAEITLEIDENLTINTFEHIFSNIIMILIDNSLDVFKENIKGNKIEIKIDKHYDKIIINYKDNAGGIKITPIEKVFDYCESTKQQSSNKGSGLAILKLFVEDKLYGKVDIKNIDNGVLFYIVF